MPNVQKKQSALPFYRRSKLLGYCGARSNFTFTPDTNDFINVFLPGYLYIFFGRPFDFLSSFYCKHVINSAAINEPIDSVKVTCDMTSALEKSPRMAVTRINIEPDVIIVWIDPS